MWKEEHEKAVETAVRNQLIEPKKRIMRILKDVFECSSFDNLNYAKNEIQEFVDENYAITDEAVRFMQDWNAFSYNLQCLLDWVGISSHPLIEGGKVIRAYTYRPEESVSSINSLRRSCLYTISAYFG